MILGAPTVSRSRIVHTKGHRFAKAQRGPQLCQPQTGLDKPCKFSYQNSETNVFYCISILWLSQSSSLTATTQSQGSFQADTFPVSRPRWSPWLMWTSACDSMSAAARAARYAERPCRGRWLHHQLVRGTLASLPRVSSDVHGFPRKVSRTLRGHLHLPGTQNNGPYTFILG